MSKCIVKMHLSFLSTIHGSWHVPSPTLPTPWMDRNSELRMAGDKQVADLLIGFF